MSYSNPTTCAYTFPATTLSTAGTVATIVGPSGKTGRLVDVGMITTTAVTVADETVTVGVSGDIAAYGSKVVPFTGSSIGDDTNGMTLVDKHIVAADTAILVTAAGTSTAGAADLFVTIDWE